MTNNLSLDVNWVGSHGQHLFDSIDINQPLPGVTNTAAAENARRPFAATYPWFSQMKVLGAATNISNYDALQVVARQKMSHGLSMLASYTYSHALDNQSSDLNPVLPQDGRNMGAEYGNSSFDIRHRLAFAPSYNLPGRPGYFQMLQGWQITTTAKVWSGSPINPIDATDDISGTGEGQDRWTLGGSSKEFGGFGGFTPVPCFAAAGASTTWTKACTAGLPQQCVDAAAGEPLGPGGATGTAMLNKLGCYMIGNSVLVPAAAGTFGSMGRFQIRAFGTWEVDSSIIKTFKIKENVSTQFRAEIYNITNTIFFSAPSATLSSPTTFGASSSTPDSASPFVGTGGPRKIQLGLKILF